MTHLESLFAALYVSEGWYATYQNRAQGRSQQERRRALYCKARALVVFDRVRDECLKSGAAALTDAAITKAMRG